MKKATKKPSAKRSVTSRHSDDTPEVASVVPAGFDVAGRQGVYLPYSQIRGKIKDGDMLLFRRSHGLMGKAISVAGRSEYSHAAMAAWWNGRLMCLEVLQGFGGRATMLSRQVEAFGGRIDVYAANATRKRFSRRRAVGAMIEMTGVRYGWWALLKAALLHLPVIRFMVTPDTNDKANGSVPFCSQAVSRAVRAGGVDPVPNLADAETEPGDLARSAFFEYRCTLVPDDWDKPEPESNCLDDAVSGVAYGVSAGVVLATMIAILAK